MWLDDYFIIGLSFAYVGRFTFSLLIITSTKFKKKEILISIFSVLRTSFLLISFFCIAIGSSYGDTVIVSTNTYTYYSKTDVCKEDPNMSRYRWSKIKLYKNI